MNVEYFIHLITLFGDNSQDTHTIVSPKFSYLGEISSFGQRRCVPSLRLQDFGQIILRMVTSSFEAHIFGGSIVVDQIQVGVVGFLAPSDYLHRLAGGGRPGGFDLHFFLVLVGPFQ